MPITKATLAANPNHVNSGVRIRMVCARKSCHKVIWVVESQAKRRVCCSKRCAAIYRKAIPPRTNPDVQSERMRRRFADDPTSNPFYGRTPTNYRGWGHGGYVSELGYSVRSSWERDYLIALQQAGVEFEYEPHRVDLGDGTTYLPDVLIDDTNFYIEITGWDKPIKKLKRQRFVEIYDVRLHVVSVKPTTASIVDLIAVCEEVMP